VVLVSDQFENLAKVVLRTQNIPNSIALTIPRGNPEYIPKDELGDLADEILSEGVKRLTSNPI